jgi:hypothetical protein
MTFAESPWNSLVIYPACHSDAVRTIDVRVRHERPGLLSFEYVLHAEMARIRTPPTRLPTRADGLWEHTCFEAFIATADTPRYYELNFSPSREWAIYRFDAYRDGMSPIDVALPPELIVRRFDDRLELDATVRLPELTAPQPVRTLQLALSAVVEEDSGTLSYWALKHAAEKPDFHHSDGFVLELPT